MPQPPVLARRGHEVPAALPSSSISSTMQQKLHEPRAVAGMGCIRRSTSRRSRFDAALSSILLGPGASAISA